MPQVVINPGKKWMRHAFNAAVGCLRKWLLSCLAWSADRTGIVWMSGITENRVECQAALVIYVSSKHQKP